jgi:hypothetical protein
MHMLDAMKGYLQIASGITEVTVARARDVASAIIAQSVGNNADDMVEGVQQLAEELLTTGKDNREMLVQLVRMEVDRAVGKMGFVREDELASLRRHVDTLESELARAQSELTQVREDAATSSIMAAADAVTSTDTQDIAASVVDSARRIVTMTGAIAGMPDLASGPWARVARDLATSAAGIVAAAGEQSSAPSTRKTDTDPQPAGSFGAPDQAPAAPARTVKRKPAAAKKSSTTKKSSGTRKSSAANAKSTASKKGQS